MGIIRNDVLVGEHLFRKKMFVAQPLGFLTLRNSKVSALTPPVTLSLSNAFPPFASPDPLTSPNLPEPADLAIIVAE